MPPLRHEFADEGKSVMRNLYPTKETYDFYRKYSDKRLSEISLLAMILEIQRVYNAEMYGM